MSKYPLFNLKNILAALLILIQVMICFYLLLYEYYSLVEKRVSRDFLVYYSAGYIIKYDSPANMYNLELQRQIQENSVQHPDKINFFPYNHPPITSPFLGWAVSKDLFASNFRWILVLFGFNLASLGVLIKLMQYLKSDKKDIWLVALTGLVFYPTIMAYIKGQDSTFLLLGVCLWVLGLISSKDNLAGLGLALVMIRPQIALVLSLPFLFKKRSVWWWFMGWGFLIFLLSFFSIGPTGFTGLLKAIVLSGKGLGFDVDIMATLMGAILRGYPSIAPSLLHIIGYAGYFSSIIFICFMWIRTSNIGFKQINIAVLFAILFAPHLHRHDLILLLVVAVGIAFQLSEMKILNLKYSFLLPMIVSFFIILGELSEAYFIYYLVILSLVYISWKPDFLSHLFKGRTGSRKIKETSL